MNEPTKKQELYNTEREQFILQFLLFKKQCIFEEIKTEYIEKKITYRGRMVSDNTIRNDINNLVKFNFIIKIGKTPYKLECSEVIKDIKDLIEKKNDIEYDELIAINFYIDNLKQIVDTLIKIKMLEKDRNSQNKLILKLRKTEAN